ncbi:sensor histidine kinase [Lederbergia sp. NSJ-179]|uniref:sensor histidine kinase n=1 Tax=Lederbergia sp. NSJ-179 TaxID=2931402 RepID=UPI001FD57B45|nr:sensor histidine kinase [Lederbergia sp. NSJ-179]MCJ7843489.1 sensor histidine kinase [Lederbergia sp. NSJ-179]
MTKLRNYFNNKSIRFKLLSYFFIIIILCVSTLSLIGGKTYKESLEEEANLHTIQMIDQVWNNIEMVIQENDNIMDYITNEKEVAQFMERSTPSKKSVSEIKDKMKIYKQKHPEIAGILLVNQYDHVVSNEILRVSRDPLTKEIWYKKAIQSPENIQLISNPIGRNIKNKVNYQMNYVLSLVKAIKNPETNQVTGVILMDLKLDFIKNVIESIKIGNSGFIFITDKEGEIVYAPVNSIVYRIHPSWLQAKNSPPIEKNINDDKYQIIYNTIPDIGWKVVGVFSLNETTKVVTEVQHFTIVIAIITLAISSIVSVFFANMITKPLNKLKTLMGNVEEGHFDVRFNSKYNDEVGQLGNSYNKMVQEIDRLIQLLYVKEKSKREEELKVLQAQIQPHFLYNTLDTIQWMAYEYKAPKIAEMVNSLTTLFRIGLNKGKEFISIREELEHVRSYLIIQMTRYESKLEYDIKADEEVKDYQILKLILQPLVENSIYHGIRNKRGKGRITITVTRQDENLLLCVMDTGKGIKEEMLKQLNHSLKMMGTTDRKGYGLHNVNERIKLSYGAKYGLEVFSEYEQGTEIQAILPIKRT